MKLAAVAVAITACSSDPPSCKDVAERAVVGDRAWLAAQCERDDWSSEMRRCADGATATDELADCFTSHHPSATPGEPLRTIEAFTSAMCACADKTCSDRVHDDMRRWGDDIAERSDGPMPADARTADALARYTECHARALTGVTSYAPELVAVAPALGDAHGGTYVVLKGQRFLDEPRTAQVYFGARQGTVVRFASNTELIVEAPGGIAGERVDVRVEFSPGGRTVLANAFSFRP